MATNKNKTAPPVTVERGKDHVVIHPRNVLKTRSVIMTDGPMTLDETAVRRAEQALKALSSQFNGWMEDTVRKLTDLRDATVQENFPPARVLALHRAAHDIRGQATTLGFPLASRVGASLCLLLEQIDSQMLANEPYRMLLNQHVDAIRAITREGVTKAAHPIGDKLAAELELMTEQVLAHAAGTTVH